MNTRTNHPTNRLRRSAVAAMFAATATVASLAAATSVDAGSHRVERSEVVDIADGSPTGVSAVHRTGEGIHAVLSTTALERGDAYTVWAVVFNHPEYCDGPCDAADLADPDVDGVSTLLTGKVAARSHVVFAGRVPVGDVLTDPTGAELHLVVRTHGPVIPELRREQVSTLNGGCPPNTCSNVQMAIHQA